jgi:hypothetical protein
VNRYSNPGVDTGDCRGLKASSTSTRGTVSPQTITKPITVFEPNTTLIPAPSPAPTHYETTTTKPPDREIEARQVIITTAPSPVKSQVMLTTTITAAAATAVTTATNTTVEQHDSNPQDSEELEKERRGNGEERDDEMQQTREENKGSSEREERRDDEGMEEKVRDDRPTATACTAYGSACKPQRLDWATEINELIGPVPSVSNFRPATPSQPICAPLKPSITPPNGDEASNTVGVTLTKAVPVDATPVLHKHKPVPSPNEPVELLNATPAACTEPNSITPVVTLPKILRGLCDFSSLRSSAKNPWSSLNQRRHQPYSGNCRTSLHREQPQYLHPQHSEPHSRDLLSRSLSYLHSQSQLNPHPRPCSPAQLQPPVHIFQIIQHPHGISPDKPKITKTISTATKKIHNNIHTTRSCGNIIPAYSPYRRSWRFLDARDMRFRRSRRFRNREQGCSHV